jgi:hypothetical protein
MREVPCRLCGKPIVWANSPDRKTRIPLDPRPAVYRLSEQGQAIIAERMGGAMVSHFVTCPNVGKLKRKEQPSAPATENPSTGDPAPGGDG